MSKLNRKVAEVLVDKFFPNENAEGKLKIVEEVHRIENEPVVIEVINTEDAPFLPLAKEQKDIDDVISAALKCYAQHHRRGSRPELIIKYAMAEFLWEQFRNAENRADIYEILCRITK